MGYAELLDTIRHGEDMTAEIRTLQAEAALVAADWTAAAGHAAAVLESPAGPRVRSCALRVMALVRARQGDPEIWPLLDEALRLHPAAAVVAAREEAAWLCGRTGDMPALELPGPYGAALPGEDRCGELARSFHALRRLGAYGAARIIARRLAERGVRGLPQIPRGAAKHNPAGLTARELEVLQLVSEGLRDADISERLVLSQKTVGHHVCSILRKLGVPSRTAAAHCLRLAA